VGIGPHAIDLKAERRKPSGEKHCDIEDIPSLTGVLAHFRLHEYKAIRKWLNAEWLCGRFKRLFGFGRAVRSHRRGRGEVARIPRRW
jgi:hypothetical protein